MSLTATFILFYVTFGIAFTEFAAWCVSIIMGRTPNGGEKIFLFIVWPVLAVACLVQYLIHISKNNTFR